MASGNKNIIKYKKSFRLNMGIIIFLILFIYLCFSTYTYLGRSKVRFYEVVDGGMVTGTEKTGIILRSEEIQTAPGPGYISYYIREGKRASVGTKIYSMDETGNMKRFLEDNSLGNIEFTDENINELSDMMTQFTISYSDDEFSGIYREKDSIEALLSEYTSMNALDNLDDLMNQNGIKYTRVTANAAGVVSFYTDSYAQMQPEEIKASDFDRSAYQANLVKSGDQVEGGNAIYKLVTSENWSIVFPITPEEQTEYAEKKQLTVVFRDNDLTLQGSYKMVTGADQANYGVVTFDKYMVKFISDRFANFYIRVQNETGLKIPKSAVTTKTFYTIPLDYLAKGDNDVGEGFYKEVYSDEGTSIEFVETDIFNKSDTDYYVDASGQGPFKAGDYLVKPGSTERFQINATDSLQGVYNINKGYAVFKKIEILAENDEYDTVKKNTKYGLNAYDHIMLNGTDVNEGDVIYQ